ncbi:MAG TPA: DNA alkylation repair protein [Burkholderiaceae bacterium]|nr:DNA alkylation repair protein [Burkholderiaceae bacterium]
MADTLKSAYGPEVVRRIARGLAFADPSFRADAFEADVLDGFDGLELMPRVHRIAEVLHRHLPGDYPRAVEGLLRSLEATQHGAPASPMAGFLYLPHTMYVARYGLDAEHFDLSMQALHALTKRSTAEYAIRPFIERHADRTLARLRQWTADDSEHVRRLVSEGTRPRLPWASRLREFQRDPAPVLALLERLKDDPSEYVRRSVANNLNDIGKDHPALLLATCRRWVEARVPAPRRALVRHALRTLLKQCDPQALALLGFGDKTRLAIGDVSIEPPKLRIGERLRIAIELRNDGEKTQQVLADLRIRYVKADGTAQPRVFRLQSLELSPGQRETLRKTVSMQQMTTRRHYPGRHGIELLLNGEAHPLGDFELRPPMPDLPLDARPGSRK